MRKGSVVYLAVKGGWGMPSAWRLGASITSLNQRTALSMWFLRRDEQDRIVSGRGIVRGPCSAVAVDRVLALGRDALRPPILQSLLHLRWEPLVGISAPRPMAALPLLLKP